MNLRRFDWRRLPAAHLLAGSFLVMILFGTLGLRFVPAFYVDGIPLGWIDALFTATSAVCVTGLILVDTATHFTRLGQGFLLLLIQVGGLGMITITTLVILSLGRRLTLRAEAIVPQNPGRGAPSVFDRWRLTRDVVLFTLVLEAVGALVLLGFFLPSHAFPDALWHAVFQAVSAFCNAGFSSFSDSLEGWAGHPGILWPIMVLIVTGGIGFLTLEELAARWRASRQGRSFRLSLHSRIVLWTTGALLAAGWVLFAFFEWRGTLGSMSVVDRLQNALFMSVTARTAGFNTIPYVEAADPTNFLNLLLMFIGGSPGSTAGGLKTTTFFLIGLLAWSRIRGRTAVSVWNRTVPFETVQRAVGVFAVAGVTIAGAIFLLTVLETARPAGEEFMALMFEAVSAFNTVGLSLGVTDELRPASRVLVTILMFVGRIGPLSFAAAIAVKAESSGPRFRYAHEDVTIG